MQSCHGAAQLNVLFSCPYNYSLPQHEIRGAKSNKAELLVDTIFRSYSEYVKNYDYQ